MDCVVVSPFKTGSSTLSAMLDACEVPHVKSHDPQSCRAARVILMPVRPQEEIYPSAFFQDLDQVSYPYAVSAHRHIIEALPVHALVDHYHRFPWPTYPWLNYPTYTRELAARLGFAVDLDFPGTHVVHRSGEVCVGLIKTACLEPGPVLALAREAGLPVAPGVDPGALRPANRAADKWYAGLYRAFTSHLRSTSPLRPTPQD